MRDQHSHPTSSFIPADGVRPSAVWIVLALVALVAVAYGGAVELDFIDLDDRAYVTENPYVRDGFSSSGISWAFTNSYAANWHPVTWFSHMLDCQWFGLDPRRHHLMSVGIHMASAALLFFLLYRLTGRPWPSAAVAALFAVHPVNVESVAWIAERKNVLSTLLWILTMWFYSFYAARPSGRRMAAVAAVLALGLMSKAMLVTLPLALLLMDIWPLNRWSGWRRMLVEKIPMFALVGCSILLTLAAQRQGGSVATLERFPIELRVANALMSCVAYLKLVIWPSGLAFFYPFPAAMPPIWKIAGAVLILGGITVYAVRSLPHRPYVTVGWLWYLVTLVPVMGLVQVGTQAMADRYMYVPQIGLFIAVVWRLSDLARAWRPGFVVARPLAVLALSVLAVVTRSQVRHWRTSEAVYERALAVTMDNHLAHYNLAVNAINRGDYERAAFHFHESIRIAPALYPSAGRNLANAHTRLGSQHYSRGDLDTAFLHFSTAALFAPSASIHNNLGLLLSRQGRLDSAVGHYREAIRLQPDYDIAHYNLGNALAQQEKYEEAMAEYGETLKLNPAHTPARMNLDVVKALSRGRAP